MKPDLKIFQEKVLKNLSRVIDKHATESRKDPEGPFIVFVDGMDGDVCWSWTTANLAAVHAFRKGATEVVIKLK
jgi:hypothetical protein